MNPTLLRRLAITGTLATLLVMGTITTSHAEPTRGRSLRGRATRTLRRGLRNGRSFMRQHKGKIIVGGAAALGFAVGTAGIGPTAAFVGGALVGAAKVVGAVAATKISLGGVAAGLAAGRAAHVVSSKPQGTSAFKALKNDAKHNWFGLKGLFSRGNSHQQAPAAVVPQAEHVGAPIDVAPHQ
ncbi:MAG: hypothetical protein KC503_00455 [Myxococcales bacterium]|nr:hypothetical protein [Myxococcales bacterium]